ncbi:MAG: DUF1015 domain-containing protein [Bacteroidota bacterium]
MAKINPFKAVRPTRDKVALVTTRSYEIYEKQEKGAILKYNPFSFLHILKPGFKFKKVVSGEKRFKMVRNRYSEFKENHIFIKDDKPVYYLHQKSFEDEVFWGIIAASDLSDYENNIIKKHEKTLHEREALFGHYLEVTGFNAEPVLITYPNNEVLLNIYHKYRSQRAEYEFTTNKKRTHLFWVIDDIDDIENIRKEFLKMDAVYIADGHHRTASSLYLKNQKIKQIKSLHKGKEDYNFFMSYMISDSNLKISSFDRFVKSLKDLNKEEFLIKLDEYFRIENLGQQFYKPSKKHHFSMYLDGEFYKLYLRKNDYKISNPLDELDPQILFKTILEPILGIKDLSNNKDIMYIPEILSQSQLKDKVDSGKYAIGFRLFPVSIDQLKAVADANLIMPPKSTYIEPKLRSGLTIFELN